MKLRLAKKLLMRPWNKVAPYWIKQLSKENGKSILEPYRDHRLEKAATTIRRWRENKCK